MTKTQKTKLKKWLVNLLKFTAPFMAVFFFQLSQGVSFKMASGIALVALYGAVADLLKKVK